MSWTKSIKFIDPWLPVGPRSVLFGAHQFLVHPIVLAIAWWKLYGFPWDPRLWVAFVVHDLGYLFQWCRNMDGPEGETHVEFGANVMHWLFDWPREIWVPGPVDRFGGQLKRGYQVFNTRWRDFCLFHSRFYAKKHNAQVSKLCIADKMAIVIMPTWLWVTLCRITGEIDEYLLKSQANREQESKYVSMHIYNPDHYEFFENIKTYLRAWVKEHLDGREDSWTPKR